MQVPLFDIKLQNAKIREAAIDRFSKVFDSSAFVLGEGVKNFEQNMARYLGVSHALGVSSGTDALLLAMMALGIGPGDEVICPSFTFFATAGCISRVGAKPVFVDINLDDFNASCEDIEQKITTKTKAIIVVHLFGQAARLESIIELAANRDIPVVEDCAQSLGATRNGHQTGTVGTIGCFSFYPTKNLGGFGDAGLVCTNDDQLAEKCKILRVHGMESRYFHKYIGGNFRIDEIQAALLDIKLPYVDEYVDHRRQNALFYLKELAGVEDIILPQEIDGNFHTWNQFTIRVQNGKRDKLLAYLKEHDVGSNVYYPMPLDLQECFKDFVNPRKLTQNAKLAASEVISLPIYPELTPDQLSYVVETIRAFFK